MGVTVTAKLVEGAVLFPGNTVHCQLSFTADSPNTQTPPPKEPQSSPTVISAQLLTKTSGESKLVATQPVKETLLQRSTENILIDYVEIQLIAQVSYFIPVRITNIWMRTILFWDKRSQQLFAFFFFF